MGFEYNILELDGELSFELSVHSLQVLIPASFNWEADCTLVTSVIFSSCLCLEWNTGLLFLIFAYDSHVSSGHLCYAHSPLTGSFPCWLSQTSGDIVRSLSHLHLLCGFHWIILCLWYMAKHNSYKMCHKFICLVTDCCKEENNLQLCEKVLRSTFYCRQQENTHNLVC